MDRRAPQDEALANVFVTVLFPEVPTGAPTGVAVPIEVTVTGTLNAADVPTGFQVPTDAATAPPATATPAPTDTATQQTTTAAPSETTAQTSQTTESTQSTASTRSTSTPSTLSTTTRPTTSASRTSLSSASGTASTAGASASPTAIGNSHHDTLSAGAIAGIVIGVVAFVAALALMFLFLMRPSKRKSMRAQSPGVYPEEAYLYDPPMSGGAAGGMPMKNVDAETRSMRAQSFGRPATPNMSETERVGLLGGAAAAGAAARSRRGTMSGNASPALRPAGGNGYAPVDTRDITEMGGNPFADQDTAYRPSTEVPPAAAGGQWPMNPRAPSGLGTPPASRGGPAEAMDRLDPVESRSQTPGSMYRDNPGPSSNAMREARRAWGMD